MNWVTLLFLTIKLVGFSHRANPKRVRWCSFKARGLYQIHMAGTWGLYPIAWNRERRKKALPHNRTQGSDPCVQTGPAQGSEAQFFLPIAIFFLFGNITGLSIATSEQKWARGIERNRKEYTIDFQPEHGFFLNLSSTVDPGVCESKCRPNPFFFCSIATHFIS